MIRNGRFRCVEFLHQVEGGKAVRNLLKESHRTFDADCQRPEIVGDVRLIARMMTWLQKALCEMTFLEQEKVIFTLPMGMAIVFSELHHFWYGIGREPSSLIACCLYLNLVCTPTFFASSLASFAQAKACSRAGSLSACSLLQTTMCDIGNNVFLSE